VTYALEGVVKFASDFSAMPIGEFFYLPVNRKNKYFFMVLDLVFNITISGTKKLLDTA
jgi:hypothetical protein